MIPERIELDNRYNDKHYLQKIDDKRYKVCLDKLQASLLRVMYNADKSIHAIDPSGGPLIKVGEFKDGYYFNKLNKLNWVKLNIEKIECIDNEYVISLV